MALRGTAFDNPLYHFAAYGVNNPTVQWCIEQSVYRPDLCPACRGGGVRLSIYGAKEKAWNMETRAYEPVLCPTCAGSGKRGEPVLDQDFGSDEDLAIARQMFPRLRVEGHPSEFCPCRRGAPRNKCTCRPR